MERALVVALMVGYGCSSSSAKDLEERVDKLEQDAARTRDELRRLSKNDDAIIKVNMDEFADVTERLFRAGITDEKSKNIPRWWCVNGAGLCLRSEVECKAKLVQWGRESPTDKRVTEGTCEPARIAYCDPVRWCVGARSTCEKVPPHFCLGVE